MNYERRLYFRRVIILILIIALLCPIFVGSTTLKAYASNSSKTISEIENNENASTTDQVVEEHKVDNVTIDDSLVSSTEVPSFISKYKIAERGHVLRLPDEETLNTLVYLNKNGTKTKYIMDCPVKYIDQSGNAQFIDLTLTETVSAFTTLANDVVVSVAKDYTNGVTLTYGDYSVMLTAMPAADFISENISTAPITTATMVNNTVTYNDIFGAGIDVRYSPLYNGVKEDIVLEEYCGANTFNFLLYTDGLNVYLNNGIYYLAENEGADMRMELGKVIVYDAELKMAEGSMTVTAIKNNQVYKVTISADETFLCDPSTVYPVRIDPSITVSDTTHGAGAVIDSPVYLGKPTVNMGSALYNPIGYLDSTYQAGRTAVKLVGLANDSTYKSLYASNIQSAYFYIKDSSGTTAKAINLYALTSNSTWTETSLTWNTVGTISSTLQATANVGGGAWSSFNVTNLVKGWKSGSYNINCGFILQSSNESVAGNFFSSESAEANWPYLVLNYTEPTASSITLSSSSISIQEGGTSTLTATTSPSGLGVTWSTSNSSIATVSSSGIVTAKKAGTVTITASITDASGTVKSAACTVYVHVGNGVYYINNINSKLYLHVESGGIDNYTDVYQFSKYATSTSTTTRIRQMWKIYYLGNGRYSVRPMNKLNMGLDVSSGNVDIYNIGTSDTLSSVPSYGEWTIEWYSSGYVFKNNGNSSLTMQVESASTSSSATVIASTYSTSTNCRWTLTPMSETLVGVYLYNTSTKTIVSSLTKHLAPGETFSSIIAIPYSPWIIDQSVTWSTTSAATVTSAGVVTAISPTSSGATYVSARKIANGYDRSVSYSLFITEIPNGTYFIKNKETERYVDIEDATMASGTTIHQWSYHGGNSQKWVFTHLGNGTYSIKSANSTSDYYLGVNEDSADNNTTIVLRTGLLTNGMQWKIVKSSSYAYKLIPMTGESNNRVLSVGWYAMSTDGIDIQQRDYVEDTSYNDEWQIWSPIDIGISTDNYTSGCTHGERQSYRYANLFYDTLLSSPGGGPVTKTHRYNMDSIMTASKNDFSANGAISNDIDFMIYTGHGIVASGSSGNYLHYNCSASGVSHTTDHSNTAYNVYTSETNFGSTASDLRWVWLYSCNFLTTGSYVTDASLAEMMTGAHIVMGYASRSTLCDAMAETFAKYLRSGMPIYDAYFLAGNHGEASVETAVHYQKMLYIPQARYETIYSPNYQYDYDTSDVLITSRNIHDDYS